jgi:AraC family transcriptional regulator of adaptative response/methylated-DNA-[protein]-cysteine methyltransferase
LIEEYVAKVAAACRSLETTEISPSLDFLAKAAAMSKFHFHRVFTKIVGLTPKAYAKAHRAERMRAELSKSPTVTEAMYQVGFQSSGRFYAESGGMLGMTPKKFRAKGRGEIIRFAVGESSLGSLLVATSEKGICAIMLGDDPNQLARELQDQFSQAEFVGGDQKFERLVARVVGFVEAPKSGLDLPLDIRGTAFQQRVWLALCKIPVGVTVSYSDVARSIGAPKSVRAVASACAANRIALAIPCHRVVRADGHSSGYRWGVARKCSLLQREKMLTKP